MLDTVYSFHFNQNNINCCFFRELKKPRSFLDRIIPRIIFFLLSSPSLTPDDDVFKHLASTYSLNHARMYLGEPCKVNIE